MSIFDTIRGENWIPIIAITCGCLVAIIAIVAGVVKSSKESADLIALKRDLIAQGRPTDEIERICNAGVSKKC